MDDDEEDESDDAISSHRSSISTFSDSHWYRKIRGGGACVRSFRHPFPDDFDMDEDREDEDEDEGKRRQDGVGRQKALSSQRRFSGIGSIRRPRGGRFGPRGSRGRRSSAELVRLIYTSCDSMHSLLFANKIKVVYSSNHTRAFWV